MPQPLLPSIFAVQTLYYGSEEFIELEVCSFQFIGNCVIHAGGIGSLIEIPRVTGSEAHPSHRATPLPTFRLDCLNVAHPEDANSNTLRRHPWIALWTETATR